MSLAADMVKITAERDGQSLEHSTLLTERLPATFVRFLETQRPQATRSIYYVSWNTAIKLLHILQNHVNDQFRVDASAINNFIIVEPPPDFGIQWQFDRSRQTLNRVIKGADGYLGDGWFWRSNQIWSITSRNPRADLRWVSQQKIESQELFEFAYRGFSSFQSDPSFHCDLVIETDFAVQVSLHKMLKRSLEVRITSNLPGISRTLSVITGDSDNLISGVTLLPGWRKKLSGALIDVARSSQSIQISGEDLPAFIQDDLIPHAETLRVDTSKLLEIYQIEDAALKSIKWVVQHDMAEGVGRYLAVPGLDMGSEMIPIYKFLQQDRARDRFMRTSDGWLELTPAFRARLAEWQTHNLGAIRLAPQEILGSNTYRSAALGLQLPEIEIPAASSEQSHASQLIKTMRFHGIPAGISGLQQQIGSIFIEVCRQILRENKRARILWLLPQRKRSSIYKELKTSGIPFVEDTTGSGGGITFISPEKSVAGDWTLIIFSDIDVISTIRSQSRLFASLRRRWAICTFMRPDWHRDEFRADAVMTSLGMARSDLPAFLKLCVGAYANQTEGIFAVLKSPFRKFSISVDSSDADKGIPIPPRPINKPTEVHRTSPEVSISAADLRSVHPAEQFVAQAKKHANRAEQYAEPVPFMEYWPTYSSMNQAQQRWYFYWRSQLRAGQYLPTDKSYLFVHIYEVLNLVGFESPQAAFDRLANLWRNYRFQYQLDGYLINWTADFLAVHRLSPTPLEWYAAVLEAGGQPAERDTAIEAWLSLKKDFTQIPMALLKIVSEYDPLKSKFYEQYASDITVRGAYGQAISAIDTLLKQHAGKGLFDIHRPNRTFVLKHQPFGSALVAARPAEITIAEIPAWSEAKALSVVITAILKYTENALRRQRNFRGTLRGVNLTAEWATTLDALFPVAVEEARAPKKPSRKASNVAKTAPEPSYSPIVIDVNKVSQLTTESNEVRERLIVNEEHDDTVTLVAPDAILSPTRETVASTFDINRPIGTPAHLLTELSEVNAVLAGDLTVIALLQYLQQREWQVGERDAHAALDGEFLSHVVDRVNDRAIEYLGDRLLFIEGEQLIVTEDYRDELEYLFDHPTTVVDGASSTNAHATLTAEWGHFVEQMRPVHWEVLQVLLTDTDVQVRLDEIARNVYKTVDLLVDEINGFAYASVNDIVIVAGEPPVIEDEDVESLRALWDWAYENVIQMARITVPSRPSVSEEQ